MPQVVPIPEEFLPRVPDRCIPDYRNEGVWGSYSAPVFKPGVHGLPHLH